MKLPKTNPEQVGAFTTFPENLSARKQLFEEVYPNVVELCQKLGFKNPPDEILWNLWLPLTMELARAKKELDRPLIQGILGGQGTGKTTLTKVISLILSHLDYSTIGISIDDLYKTYEAREKLKQKDSRLIWRGPPKTHDIQLGIEVLNALRDPNRKTPVFVPRFDKSLHHGAGDRIEPEKVEKVDIILFEGWFVGVQPVANTVFDNPPHPIITSEDKAFAKDMNKALKEYLPLWEKLDRLIVLYPIDYRLSKQWRKEAEQKMIATGKTGMNDGEIDRFVEYFWCALHPELFITPLTKNSKFTNLVIEILPNHSPGKVFIPKLQ